MRGSHTRPSRRSRRSSRPSRPVVAGVQFGGMRPLCLPCRDPVPSPMTVGLMSADVAEPRTIIVNAICERCAALPLDVLQEDCQAAFAEWIADLKMVKDK
jgi:hypothetical protein